MDFLQRVTIRIAVCLELLINNVSTKVVKSLFPYCTVWNFKTRLFRVSGLPDFSVGFSGSFSVLEKRDIDLISVLGDMGVTSIFDSTANSLKQITDSLYVSDYSHKAKITVNEKGTEAAAASHLNFIVCGVSQNPVKFIADYPFFTLYSTNVRVPFCLLAGWLVWSSLYGRLFFLCYNECFLLLRFQRHVRAEAVPSCLILNRRL